MTKRSFTFRDKVGEIEYVERITTDEHFREMVEKMIAGKLARWSDEEYTGKMKFYSYPAQRRVAELQSIDFLLKCGWTVGTEDQLQEAREAWLLTKLQEKYAACDSDAVILAAVEAAN